MEEQSFVVPTEMVQEAEIVVALLKDAAISQGEEDQVYLLRPRSKGFGGVEIASAVLLVGGSTVTWLTKKWIDTYLWPFVQQRVDSPSKKFLDWLGSVLPGSPTPDNAEPANDESG